MIVYVALSPAGERHTCKLVSFWTPVVNNSAKVGGKWKRLPFLTQFSSKIIREKLLHLPRNRSIHIKTIVVRISIWAVKTVRNFCYIGYKLPAQLISLLLKYDSSSNSSRVLASLRDKPAPSYYHGKCIPRIRGVIKSHGRTTGRVRHPILQRSEDDSSAPLNYCTFVRSFQTILPLRAFLATFSLKILTTLTSLSFSLVSSFSSL